MIRVNGKEFEATTVFATDGSMAMSFATDETLGVIEANFPEESVIEVVENGETGAKYYNKKVMSLKVENGTQRKVTVVFTVSEIQQSAEAKLNDRADTSDGAIEELAGLVADQMATVASLSEVTTDIETRVTELEKVITTLTAKTTEVSNG